MIGVSDTTTYHKIIFGIDADSKAFNSLLIYLIIGQAINVYHAVFLLIYNGK